MAEAKDSRTSEPVFRTAISRTDATSIEIRGYDLIEMIGRISLPAMMHLLLQGELPSPERERMLEAVVVACTEHGVRPPSIQAARIAASGGSPFQASVAAGILAIGDSHGGAIDVAMEVFQRGVEQIKATGSSVAEAAGEIVATAREKKRRLPGFGHPTHPEDPRTVRLFALARELGVAGGHMELAEAIEARLREVSGKNLPLNVDGAIAAILADMGFDWRVGKGFFILGRVNGIVAHVFEDLVREKPMGHLLPHDLLAYDGPPSRELPTLK